MAMIGDTSSPIRGGLFLPDRAATARLAERLAPLLRSGDVVALGGDLGAGKTTFARNLIRILGHGDEEVPSPTYTLVQVYDLGRLTLWHFDLYRISDPDEVFELGFEDALAEGASLIEWPERLGPLLPADRLDVTLALGAGTEARDARLRAQGSWAPRISELLRDD